MAITAIKDFRIKESYTKLVEKALFSYLWEGIYKPMFEIMSVKPVIAKNSLNTIIEALRDGKIYYVDGGFRAKDKFTNAQSLQLQKWGAVWDKRTKMFRLPESKLPDELRVTLAEAQINAENQIKLLQGYIEQIELNIPYIVESMVFDNEVKTILDDAGNEIKKNVKHLNVIEPELSEQQKDEIAKAYTNNMRDYAIKDFAQERIPEMRKKIQDLVLQGYRQDKIQDLLQKEYGIMARKAKFLAQNETSIMLAEYKKVTYQKMGFDKFIWKTVTDGRERELHKALNNTVWRYDNPPVIDERTGQKGLPGETYNCRCEAIPFYDDTPFSYDVNSKKSYKRLLAKNNSDDVDWITVKGNHIPVKKGQSKEQAVEEFLERKKYSQSKTIAGVKQGKPMSFKKANGGNVNPKFYTNNHAYKSNCQTCIAAFEARLRGYNIEALPYNAHNIYMTALGYNPALAYMDTKTGKTPDMLDGEVKRPRECENWLKARIKRGERYTFIYKPINSASAHIVEVSKNIIGGLKFYDPQNGKIYNKQLLNDIAYRKHEMGFSPLIFRVDDKEINTEFLTKMYNFSTDRAPD